MRNKMIWHDPLAVSEADSAPLHAALGGHSLVAQILVRRGITTLDATRSFLDPGFYPPAPPEALPDLVIAAEHLERAISQGVPILVWGDFDVDGQTATALLVDALQRMGAQVVFYVPYRLRESHGIRLDSLREQLSVIQPGILLTCDTGVSAAVSIDYAKSQGVITLITDHHDLPPTLPPADAVVNPKRLPADHPLATLPGVGVAYKLVERLFVRQGCADELPRFLDLVALGIVADVAEQTHDTRYLLQLGLEQLRRTGRVGLRALIEVSGVRPDRLTAADIGFQLGPRLNAAGRLADAAPVVELLTTFDPGRAHLLAAQLDGLNRERQVQSRQIYAAAQEQIARNPSLLDWEALVLDHPAWHAGIIGIVASRLADHYQRPVVLLNSAVPNRARGSARSVPGYDIGAAIAAQADLLIEHGGHPGAAGLSLHADHIPAFRRRLSDTLRETKDPTIRPGLHLDAYLPFDALSLDLAAEFNRLAPFGEGNPRITLATTGLTLKSAAYMGRTRQHRRLTVEDANGHVQKVVWWNSADQALPEGMFDLAYELEINTYQGSTELQLVFCDYRRSAAAPVEVSRPHREVVDFRGTGDPFQVLRDFLTRHPQAVVWAEGYRRADSPGVPLPDLDESAVLAVYTTPAGPQPLQQALERVKPTTVALWGVDPPLRAFPDIQRRILELVKYVLNQQEGRTTLRAMAGAVGQSPELVRRALSYHAARGEITVSYRRGDALRITPGSAPPSPDAPEYLAAFQAALTETAAYRAFFHRAEPHRLLGWDDES